MNSKQLYIISLGPGDPDLITLKGIQTILSSEVLLVPIKKRLEDSRAYKIVSALKDFAEKNFKGNSFPDIQAIANPMNYQKDNWQNQVKQIIELFHHHKQVGYVTLGDVGIYSTAYYLLDIIENEHTDIYNNTTIIPGVSSFSHASASVKKPLCLGKSRLEVRPWYSNSEHVTRIYMRPKSGDKLGELKAEGNMMLFENLGFDNESILNGKPEQIKEYMSLLIDFSDEIVY